MALPYYINPSQQFSGQKPTEEGSWQGRALTKTMEDGMEVVECQKPKKMHGELWPFGKLVWNTFDSNLTTYESSYIN